MPSEKVCHAHFMLQYLLALDDLAERARAEDGAEVPEARANGDGE